MVVVGGGNFILSENTSLKSLGLHLVTAVVKSCKSSFKGKTNGSYFFPFVFLLMSLMDKTILTYWNQDHVEPW